MNSAEEVLRIATAGAEKKAIQWMWRGRAERLVTAETCGLDSSTAVTMD